MCDKEFIWNPLFGIFEKKKIDKLVEECSENIDGNEMLYNETLDIISYVIIKHLILVLYI